MPQSGDDSPWRGGRPVDGGRGPIGPSSQEEQHMTETPNQPDTALTEDEQKTVRSAALRAGALVAQRSPGSSTHGSFAGARRSSPPRPRASWSSEVSPRCRPQQEGSPRAPWAHPGLRHRDGEGPAARRGVQAGRAPVREGRRGRRRRHVAEGDSRRRRDQRTPRRLIPAASGGPGRPGFLTRRRRPRVVRAAAAAPHRGRPGRARPRPGASRRGGTSSGPSPP